MITAASPDDIRKLTVYKSTTFRPSFRANPDDESRINDNLTGWTRRLCSGGYKWNGSMSPKRPDNHTRNKMLKSTQVRVLESRLVTLLAKPQPNHTPNIIGFSTLLDESYMFDDELRQMQL